MRFSMPYLPCEFEIPDDWLSEAGFTGFRPNGSAYRSSVPALCVPLTQIEPIVRNVTQPKDFAGFERGRLVHLLKRIVAGDEIDPVDGMKLPVSEICGVPYRYRVCDGFHRFHASVAAGFDALPMKV